MPVAIWQSPPCVAAESCCKLLLTSCVCRRDARQLDAITRALAGVLVAPRMQPAAWYSAAEAATGAIYALHPAPGALCAAIVHQLVGPALGESSQMIQRLVVKATVCSHLSIELMLSHGCAEASWKGRCASPNLRFHQLPGKWQGQFRGLSTVQPLLPMHLCCGNACQYFLVTAGGGGAAPGDGSLRRPSDSVSAVHLSRLFFTIGQVALQHLVSQQLP